MGKLQPPPEKSHPLFPSTSPPLKGEVFSSPLPPPPPHFENNIVELFDVLPNFLFTTSETKCNY